MLKYFTSKFKRVYSEGILLDANWPKLAIILYFLFELDIYHIHLNSVLEIKLEVNVAVLPVSVL